jgi:hypothetical protein
MNRKIDLLVGSELAVNILIANYEKFDVLSNVNLFITDVLNYVLQQKAHHLPFDYVVLETSFSGLIKAINTGWINEFDESWQYLILYSSEWYPSSSMLILVEDDWFLTSVDESGRFVNLGTLLSHF